MRQLLLDVQATPSVELAVVEVAARPRRRRPSVFRAYEWLDRRLFASEPDALEPVPIGLSLERVDAPRTKELDRSLASFLESYKPDVVINLGSVANELVAPKTRLGAWWLSMRAPELPHGGPIAFDELLRGTVVGTALLAVKASGESVVLQKSYTAVDRVSLQRTRNRLLWRSMRCVPRSLAAVQAQGPAYLDRSRLSTVTQTTAAEPPAHVVIGHVLRTAAGIGRRRLRRLLYRDQWFVAIRRRESSDVAKRITGDAPTNDFAPILTSRGAYFADPFLFEHAGTTHLFVERFSYRERRGSIWCCALDGEGRPGPLIPVVVSESHVSYPFVFTSEDRIYLLTEAEEGRRVPLYEAADFPAEWREHPPLLQNIDAVDPTLVEKDGLFWLFVNSGLNGDAFDDELHLFFAETLAGAWHSHPLNPIVSDVRRARPAGRIFELDGTLVRPSQDCAEAYGHAVVFNRIDVMTPTAYSEMVIGRMDPTWSEALAGTHTYGFDSRFEVVDGIRPYRRFPWRNRSKVA